MSSACLGPGARQERGFHRSVPPFLHRSLNRKEPQKGCEGCPSICMVYRVDQGVYTKGFIQLMTCPAAFAGATRS